MKKKIITLALAVVMCLSVITSVTAASTLNRVASTIPGTDIEYNYVENVTVQIPGTDVTYELTGVYEKVGLFYEGKIPVYRFSFLEYNYGKVKVNNDGMYYSLNANLIYSSNNNEYIEVGDATGGEAYTGFEFNSWNFSYGEGEIAVRKKTAYITEDNTLVMDKCDNAIAKVEFHFGNGGINEEKGMYFPDDLMSYSYSGELNNELDFFDMFYDGKINPCNIEKIDISLLDVNYEEPINYNITDGANSVVNSNSLTIKADGEFSKFTGVKVDGEMIDSSNYTATEGSTIIEFKADYLKTLDAGEHTVSIMFTDGEATTKFEIKENIDNSNSDTNNNADKNESSDNLVTDVEIPNTDYNTSVAAAFVAMTFSGIALVALKKKTK